MFRNTNAENDEKKKKAATTIQKHVRRMLARKKYSIKHLKRNQMQNYEAFVVGNDPKMPTELDAYHEAEKKIALIATSGLRSLSLACKIGNKNHTPKIIVIDNSRQVCDFWVNFRTFVSDDAKAGTADLLLKNLSAFLSDNKKLYRYMAAGAYIDDEDASRGIKYLNQDIQVYVAALIAKYDFDFVRAIVRHASVIRQSWTDTATFASVKNILALNGIEKVYAYPSNIVSCVDSKCDAAAVLRNIEKLDPVLSIHADLSPAKTGGAMPSKVHLLENNNPTHVFNTVVNPCLFRNPAADASTDKLVMLLRQLFGAAIPAETQVLTVSLK